MRRLLVLVALLAAASAAAQAPRPNVIVLLVDDLGYGDLGAYGSVDAQTPHLDALAGRGLRFTDFYAGGPVCTPSRYALLTGLHTFRADDRRLLSALHSSTHGIGDEVTTLAEALHDDGYTTALIGKWHLGFGGMLRGEADTPFHPLHHGFDDFFGVLSGTIDYHTHWGAESPHLDWWDDRRPVPEDTLRYATRVFGERAVAFLDAHAGAGTTAPPFFLYLPVTAPHYGHGLDVSPVERLQLPLGEERAYLAPFDDLYPDDDNLRKRYLAMVAVLDDEVARVVDALDRTGLAANTVVWFISDNGGDLNHGASNGALRGTKSEPYEGGIRVPSFVVWPGRVVPGVTGQVAGNVDVLPTVLRLAGTPRPFAVDGLDLSAVLLGGPPVARGYAVPNSRLGDAYREGRWKLVRDYEGGRPLPAELYDLTADPAETADLAPLFPDTAAALLGRLPYGQPPGTPPDTTGSPVDGPDDDPGEEPGEVLPLRLRVLPNPGRAGTVELTLTEGLPVRVEVFDTLGRRLAVLHDGPLVAGAHRLPLPSGAPGVVAVRALGPFGVLTARAVRLH